MADSEKGYSAEIPALGESRGGVSVRVTAPETVESIMLEFDFCDGDGLASDTPRRCRRWRMSPPGESDSLLIPLSLRVRVTSVYRIEHRSTRSPTHIPTGYVTIDITRDDQRQVALRTVRREHLGQELAGIVQDELGLDNAMVPR